MLTGPQACKGPAKAQPFVIRAACASYLLIRSQSVISLHPQLVKRNTQRSRMLLASHPGNVCLRHVGHCPQQSAATPPARLPCGAAHRRKVATVVQLATYQAPSSVGGATELEVLSTVTQVVPDSVLMASSGQKDIPRKAATVSAGVLCGILSNPAGLQDYKTAIERARVYDKCAAKAGAEKLACQLDKALVNVGALFMEQVEGKGRVSTEVDPRLARDTEALVRCGMNLVEEYKQVEVPSDRYLLRIPATWEGIQAARQLEDAGIATHLVLVYSYVQAVAAAQAGASVIQPNVGRLADYFKKNPGALRDPKGPRQDAGGLSGPTSPRNPGISLVEKIYSYVQQKHPKSKVMATGIRHKTEALELAGVDFMTVSPAVWEQLNEAATLQGYNDGFTAASGESGLQQRLSSETAAAYPFEESELAAVSQESFASGLGTIGVELLDDGIKGLQDSVERLASMFSNIAIDAE